MSHGVIKTCNDAHISSSMSSFSLHHFLSLCRADIDTQDLHHFNCADARHDICIIHTLHPPSCVCLDSFVLYVPQDTMNHNMMTSIYE